MKRIYKGKSKLRILIDTKCDLSGYEDVSIVFMKPDESQFTVSAVVKDVDNRPHQIWDEVYGKKAITEWNVLDVEKYTAPDGSRRDVTRIQYIPHTGRTHQLRLVSADSHGFGMPIIGDTLYGRCEPGERLMLHAKKITFPHPRTGEKVTFECKEPF